MITNYLYIYISSTHVMVLVHTLVSLDNVTVALAAMVVVIVSIILESLSNV